MENAFNPDASTHQQEIETTRIGGLGGSDAALVLKAGKFGTEDLTKKELERIAVMLGQMEYKAIAPTPAMIAGHLFEEFIESAILTISPEAGRETYMEKTISKKFKTFAHADFTDGGKVIECKFVQASDEATLTKYRAQLQWYYLLGADEVVLCHGTGDVSPFFVKDVHYIPVERNETVIEQLKAGIKAIEKFIKNFEYNGAAIMEWDEIDEETRLFVEYVETLKQAADSAKELFEANKENLLKMMKEKKIQTVHRSYNEEDKIIGLSCTIKKSSTAKVFSKELLFAEHKELDLPKYYKDSNRSESLSLAFNDPTNKKTKEK